jgi:hypothetical protein
VTNHDAMASTAVTSPPAPSVRASNGNGKHWRVETMRASNGRLIGRAIAAYARAGNWDSVSQPGAEVVTIGGLTYVVLRGRESGVDGAVLAVYRVLPGKDGAPGQLKSLRRYPPEIDGRLRPRV